MRWIKKGRIFSATGNPEWMHSHTQVPCTLVFENRIRIYFSTRLSSGMSVVAFLDVDIENPGKILYLHDVPVLSSGEPGMFDEHGVIPNHVFRHDGRVYLFYVGWSRRESIPYSNWMGMAVSDDDGVTFTRTFPGPILDRTPTEVYSATGLICLLDKGVWHGWYATGTQWLRVADRYEHTYELRYCYSANLVDWERPNQPIFPSKLPNESSTRPTVIFLGNKWHMWFCYRGTEDFRNGSDSYRMGYARSLDLQEWVRDDTNAGIDLSPEGWDSKMIAYPCVVSVRDKVFMFYVGNGFGQAGFGYAELALEDELKPDKS
jgi:hypothetical protein